MIFNLSTLPELTAQTFSKFLVASIKSIARKRQKNNFLCPTYLFMDEAHLTTSGSWNVMLEQLRGFGLHLMISHQFPQQLGEQLNTVKHNTAIKIFSITDEQEDGNSISKVSDGVRKLRDYEFYLKCRNRRVQIFKIPKKFITKRKKYEMSKKDLAFQREMQLERYYRKIEQKKSQIIIQETVNQNQATSNPIPPFALNLK